MNYQDNFYVFLSNDNGNSTDSKFEVNPITIDKSWEVALVSINHLFFQPPLTVYLESDILIHTRFNNTYRPILARIPIGFEEPKRFKATTEKGLKGNYVIIDPTTSLNPLCLEYIPISFNGTITKIPIRFITPKGDVFRLREKPYFCIVLHFRRNI